jgi:hypothetical protein
VIQSAFLLSTWWDSVVRLEAFAIGTLVTAVVTLLHVILLTRIVRRYKRSCQGVGALRHPVVASYYYFGLTILLMVLLHVLDGCIWSGILVVGGLVRDIHEAFYFSANAYTTLSYGAVPLASDWRELAPIMAICGLFTFGCTTSQLFAVMGYHNNEVEKEWAARKAEELDKAEKIEIAQSRAQ